MEEDNSSEFTGEIIDLDEELYLESTGDFNPPDYMPGDIITFEPDEDIPEWLAYQTIKMRKRADEVNDILDIYGRFLNEDWNSIPSEIDGFLREHGFEGEKKPLEYLAELGAEKAVKLEEKRNLVNDTYNGDELGRMGERSDLEQEVIDKINAELAHASYTLTEVERSGATTEGGYTPPKPMPEIKPENSMGFAYRKFLEEEAQNVDWLFDRRAYRE